MMRDLKERHENSSEFISLKLQFIGCKGKAVPLQA
jgi:hypothetical protein